MKKIMVKCPVCGQEFDRNNPAIEQVFLNRRYYHKECFENRPAKTPKDADKNAFFEYVVALLGSSYDAARTQKLAKNYIKEYQYTYSGMLKTLKYFYEVKHNNPAKANGSIGIIPYAYQDAYNYYKDIYEAQQQQIPLVLTVRPPEVVILNIESQSVKSYSWFEKEVEDAEK